MCSHVVRWSVQFRISKREFALDVRIAGLPECLEESGASLQNVFGSLAIVGRAHDVWNARQRILDNKHVVVLKISVLPAEICAISAELRQWTSGNGQDVKVLALAAGL